MVVDECLLTKGRLGVTVAVWTGAVRVVDVRAIETSSLLKHADHNDFFLFPAQILAVAVVNGERHGGIFKSCCFLHPQ
jgi:hypothetical protein